MKRMNEMLRISVIGTLFFMLYGTSVQAQITVGSVIDPVKGALLDLKDHASTETDSTTSTTGGLVLPRVKLVNRTQLGPFIAGDPSEQAKREHIGLTVYNLTTNSYFHYGIYVWTGNEWRPLEIAPSYIYLPSFNLPWNGTSINLYDVYKNNFNPTSSGTHKSSRPGDAIGYPDFDELPSDFYYAVTYYDPAVITITGISASGVMTYTKNASLTVPPDNAYINVVMIRK